MGRGGDRRSKTPEQRRRDGSRERPRHRDKAQPTAPPGRPDKPADLAEAAALEWDRLADILESEGRLTVSDGPWLDAVAEAYGEMLAWRAAALVVPRTFVASNGDPKPHPEHQQRRLAVEAYRKLLAEGGITPQSRARVSGGGSGGDDDDEFEAHQRKGDQIRNRRGR